MKIIFFFSARTNVSMRKRSSETVPHDFVLTFSVVPTRMSGWSCLDDLCDGR